MITDEKENILPPPEVPEVFGHTYHSIIFQWKEYLLGAMAVGDSRPLYTLQVEDHIHRWTPVYCGYSKKPEVTGLQPGTKYHFRLGVTFGGQTSAWSVPVSIATKKEPISASELHRAVQYGYDDRVQSLITQTSIPVDVVNRYGLTPLMQASWKGNDDLVKVLLDAGADPQVQSHGARKTALMMASFAGHLSTVQLLRKYGSCWDTPDRGGCTALHHAVDGEHEKVVSFALEDGANIEAIDNAHWTPLMRAIVMGHSTDVVKTLLVAGANIEVVDCDQKTCLMQAVLCSIDDIVQLLLSYGADCTVKNKFGKTVLDMAKSLGRKSLKQLLEDKI